VSIVKHSDYRYGIGNGQSIGYPVSGFSFVIKFSRFDKPWTQPTVRPHSTFGCHVTSSVTWIW